MRSWKKLPSYWASTDLNMQFRGNMISLDKGWRKVKINENIETNESD